MSNLSRMMADQRSAKAATPAAESDDLIFEDRGGRILAMLGVIVVAQITINPAGDAEYLWACHLPMMPRQATKARDRAAAERAVAHQVRQWCEAAGLVVSAAALRKLRGK